MNERIYNFSPGPAVLPIPVLENVRENLLNYKQTGLGVMELSHRGKQFSEIIEAAETRLRKLLSIGDGHEVLFVQGGATTQFAMVPMNLLGSNQTADYILTGSWAEKAFKEAKKFGETSIAASSKDENFCYLPESIKISNNSAYLHFTSNNTIAGTQYSNEPDAKGGTLICDASSDILHKKVDINKYGLIYAGAQKNLGPAGVTIVIVAKELLERAPDGLPAMLDYRVHAKAKSLYNTPSTFPIYVVGEVLKWIEEQGLEKIEANNQEKAGLLYQTIDESDYFYGTAKTENRSLMNVTFRLSDESKEADFIEQATNAGLNGLKGHRSVGGMRASIYNAFPIDGVKELVSFMKEFERKYA